MEEPEGHTPARRFVGYALLFLTFAYFSVVVVDYLLDEMGNPTVKSDVEEVTLVDTEVEISMAVDSDHDDRIHLAWSSRHLGTNYSSTRDGGGLWEDSKRIGPEGIVTNLFVKGDTVLVFSKFGQEVAGWLGSWQVISVATFDGGQSWSDTTRVRINLGNARVHRFHDRIYLVTCRVISGTRYRKSGSTLSIMHTDDFGQSWSRPVPLTGDCHTMTDESFAVADDGASMFVLWMSRPPEELARSGNRIHSWIPFLARKQTYIAKQQIPVAMDEQVS